MEALDALAARSVHLARCFERAVHDAGPWEIAWGHAEPAAAERVEGAAGVTFVARFPAVRRHTSGPVLAELSCAGDPVSYRYIDLPDGEGFEVAWELAVPAAVGA